MRSAGWPLELSLFPELRTPVAAAAALSPDGTWACSFVLEEGKAFVITDLASGDERRIPIDPYSYPDRVEVVERGVVALVTTPHKKGRSTFQVWSPRGKSLFKKGFATPRPDRWRLHAVDPGGRFLVLGRGPALELLGL